MRPREARSLPPRFDAAVKAARQRRPLVDPLPTRHEPAPKLPASGAGAKPLRVARAKPTVPPGKNDLETGWSSELRARELRGEVLWWRYEAIRLRLADGSFYRPDFLVLTSAGELECHETKGHMREAARVRLLVAAELYPFRFLLVRREKGGAWACEEIPTR